MAAPDIIPEGETGSDSDTKHEVVKHDEQSARSFYERVKQRLLNVNRWHELSGKGSAVFQLTDEQGIEANRPAKLGDHFRIDIPGPGTITGSGDDWVQIEAIQHSVEDDGEVLAIRVRPSADPRKKTEDVAHFFTDEASSTFSVSRTGNRISAEVHGRNEKPNLKAGHPIDKIRNALVGTGAMLGLNKPQWKSLVKGLLDESGGGK